TPRGSAGWRGSKPTRARPSGGWIERAAPLRLASTRVPSRSTDGCPSLPIVRSRRPSDNPRVTAYAETGPARAALGRHHGQTARRGSGRDDVSEGRQRRGRRVRDARGRDDDVGRAVMGWRNSGSDLQSESKEGHRGQRPRGGTNRRDG